MKTPQVKPLKGMTPLGIKPKKGEKTRDAAQLPAGVAQGAADNAPHTKRAVAQQRQADREAFDAIKDVNVAKGLVYVLDPARNVYSWLPKVDKWPTGACQVYPVIGGKATPAAKPAKGSTTPKAKTERTPRAVADRAYTKGTKKDESKAGTWRKHMLSTILAHKTTAAATAAHKASGQFSGNALDFNWSAKQGYIVFK